MTGRGIYVTAGVAAALPWLALAGIAALGRQWVWFEFPAHITVIAIALGLAACAARSRSAAAGVVFGTAAIALAWELVAEYRGLSRFGRTDLFGGELGLLFHLSVGRLATWLTGALYGALAWLAIGHRDDRRDRARAGGWLAIAGVIALALAWTNDTWLTLANLTERGTFVSSVSWPDTKVLACVAAAAACALGVALVASGLRRVSPIPRATVRRG